VRPGDRWVAATAIPAEYTRSAGRLFGLRHAFDADHIAAIDNVVRKLMQRGKAPFSVGFFFSLGHSTIVVLASIVIAATAAAMQDRLEAVHDLGGVIGTAVSALFLLIIGLANLIILKGIWAAFVRVRGGGQIVDEDLDTLLAGRGFFSRIFRPVFRVVERSWHMYPVGFLFGLGFDTATEVGDKLGLEGGFWDAIGSLSDNLTNFGFVVVGIFIASWLISAIIYKAKGYDRLQVEQS
jgi:nickel/cobalt transporter (NiCoT) family protein